MPVPRYNVTELRSGQYECQMLADLSGNHCCEQVTDVRRVICEHGRYVCSRCDCERMQFIACEVLKIFGT